MRSSYKIGRVLGFPVDLHITFLILLLLATLFGGWQMAGLLVLVFASVLVHEIGHSVVARWFGVPILGITLYPFGGMAKMAGQPPYPRQEFLIAAAGPATSMFIASFAALGWMLTGLSVLGTLGYVNFVLGIFNLLPALPMDGGRMLRSSLASVWGQDKATLVAGRLARLLAVGLAVSALWIGPMVLVIAVLVWFMAGQEIRAVHARTWTEHVRTSQREAYVPFEGGGYHSTVDLGQILNDLRQKTAHQAKRSDSGSRSSIPASKMVIEIPHTKS